MRWLYHLVLRVELPGLTDDSSYAPPSLATEGFIHASYRDAVVESARLYFPVDADLAVLQIDPRRLDVRIDIADTPRGPMPHIQGPVARTAIEAVLELAEIESAPDGVS